MQAKDKINRIKQTNLNNNLMSVVKFYQKDQQVPLEMHKVRVVQKLFLPNVEERVAKIKEAGNNTFLLQNKDVFRDMLTD